jgi:hypothetical protein
MALRNTAIKCVKGDTIIIPIIAILDNTSTYRAQMRQSGSASTYYALSIENDRIIIPAAQSATMAVGTWYMELEETTSTASVSTVQKTILLVIDDITQDPDLNPDWAEEGSYKAGEIQVRTLQIRKPDDTLVNVSTIATNADMAITNANEAAINADTATVNANIASTAANTAAINADTATANANIASTAANTAAINADTATANADEATIVANTAATNANTAAAAFENAVVDERGSDPTKVINQQKITEELVQIESDLNLKADKTALNKSLSPLQNLTGFYALYANKTLVNGGSSFPVSINIYEVNPGDSINITIPFSQGTNYLCIGFDILLKITANSVLDVASEAGATGSRTFDITVPDGKYYMYVGYTTSYGEPSGSIIGGKYLQDAIGTVTSENIQNAAVTGNKIKDNDITFDKISFKKTGKNLFNVNATGLILGYYPYLSGLNANANYFCSDWIYVNDYIGQILYISSNPYGIPVATTFTYGVFYDENKEYISQGAVSYLEVPIGAVYFRFGFNITEVPTIEKILAKKIQVEIGTSISGYDPFSEYIDPSYITSEKVDLYLPDTIHAVVGDTLQLFYRGMIMSSNPYRNDILIKCTKGRQYPRYFEYTPVSDNIGTTTFTISLRDNSGITFATKTCNIVTVAAGTSPATQKNIIVVGDSLTEAGTWVIEASRRLVGTGGTPAGKSFTNIAFKGAKTSGADGWYGAGGWGWKNYITAGSPAFRFVVSGVSSLSIGSIYTNNGFSYTIREVNITEGSGSILCQTSLATNVPQSSGTLTRISGIGDATISFSDSSLDSANPFWNYATSEIDFVTYANNYADDKIDAMYVLLGWNELSANQTDFTTLKTRVRTFADALHSQFSGAKLFLIGLQVPSQNGGIGANYGATGVGYADQKGIMRSALNLNKAYQELANESEYSSFVEYVDIASQFDSENNMPEADKIVNTRSAKTEKIGTNGVHPDTSGYYQIADVVFRSVIATFCQS